MADIKRTADAVWEGDSRTGKGYISSPSGALKQVVYTWSGRFENEPTTNPEELVAAAHAGCFSMAFASTLKRLGHDPQRLETHAILTMEQVDGRWTITRVRLEVDGQVPGLDQAAFERIADEAEQGCPISRLLRPGLQEVQVVARLK
jgi:osmotically inducible protein OsmC